MAKERNPSFCLTDDKVDDIVDRLLRGKYEKYRPVVAIEVVRAGLISQNTCRDYVVARWGPRSGHYYVTGDKNGPLSSTGVTMRTNKLWERCEPHIVAVKGGQFKSDELVWKVKDHRTYNTVCFATGSSSSARQWAFTLFGWTLREDAKIEDLRLELAGCGGAIAASIANIGMLGQLNERIKEHEDRAQRETEKAEQLRLLRDSIASASSHLTG